MKFCVTSLKSVEDDEKLLLMMMTMVNALKVIEGRRRKIEKVRVKANKKSFTRSFSFS